MKKILVSMLTTALLTCGTAMAQDKPEVDTVRWARANSGNVLVTLAKNNGYLKDVGINVIEIPLNSTSDALTALNAKQVDVTPTTAPTTLCSSWPRARISPSWAATCSRACTS